MNEDTSDPDDEEPEYQQHWKDTDRDRGILTKEDRRYLLGEKELSGQDERNTRYRIRQRVVNSILDMAFIFGEISFEDEKRIASDERLSPERPGLDYKFYSLYVALSLIRHQNSNSDEMASNIEEYVEDVIGKLPTGDVFTEGDVILSELVASVSVDIEEKHINVFDILADARGADSFKDIDMTRQEASDLISGALVKEFGLDEEGITLSADHPSEVSEEDADESYD